MSCVLSFLIYTYSVTKRDFCFYTVHLIPVVVIIE